jgi:hypothetical protein
MKANSQKIAIALFDPRLKVGRFSVSVTVNIRYPETSLIGSLQGRNGLQIVPEGREGGLVQQKETN